MTLTNYHTHNDFCDGAGKAEDYVEVAVRKGFRALGFSSHAPIPLDNEWTLTDTDLPLYLAEIDRLKARWADQIQIYKGLEIDYIPGAQAPTDHRWTALNLDYCIGSVHSSAPSLEVNPEYWCVDGPLDQLESLLETVHHNSVEEMSRSYYTRVVELARLGGFSFLGHFDLIKKRNRDNAFFREDSPWYRRHVLTALDAVAQNGTVIEVNTGAISRGYLDEVYPSDWILAEARHRDIPVMVNADAHAPDDVDCSFDQAYDLVKETGYTSVMALIDGRWQTISL